MYLIKLPPSSNLGELMLGYSIPLLYVLFLIVATAITTSGIIFKKFKRVEIVVVGLDKERVMNIAEQMSSEDVLTQVDEHTFGVILSYFDQRGGAVPTLITPPLLQDHTQFLTDLSDRSFSAAGFVEEITEEKVTIFNIRLFETRMVCISYTFAFDNPTARSQKANLNTPLLVDPDYGKLPTARRRKENLNITLLVDPDYGELTHIFTPEILPSVREIRSVIEKKAALKIVTHQMEELRNLVTKIIAAYLQVYGKTRFEGGDSV